MKLWEQNGSLHEAIAEFTVGDDHLLDQRLVKYDCIASIAHAQMLHKANILDRQELDAIVRGLEEIIQLDSAGQFAIRQQDEDCHTAIENFLTAKLGSAGKKIHTARSRNDQVLTALRLYCRSEWQEIAKLMDAFIQSLESFKVSHGSIRLAGYTHMRKAMPSSLGLWADAFIDSMADNKRLLQAVMAVTDQSPLGTGAGYGVPLATDRQLAAGLLGFPKVQNNPVYAQLSRGKFDASIIHGLAQITLDLNRFASDMLLFSMPEIGYLELPEEICTGSSMLPQKRNPDVLELLRAKHHVVLANGMQISHMVSNLPSGYNRDLQLTKKPLFESFDTAQACLDIASLVISKVRPNPDRCAQSLTPEVYAAEQAHKLAQAGVPFRDAYRQAAEATNRP